METKLRPGEFPPVTRTAALIYPHQLFDPHPAVAGAAEIVFVEEPLFFTQYAFHRQKLILHRAGMKRYAAKLAAAGHKVRYLESADVPTTAAVAEQLAKWKVATARVVDPCDDWLSRRLAAGCEKHGVKLVTLTDPHFLTPQSEIENFVRGKKKLFFTDFYIAQRKRLGVLLDGDKPVGGKWSFDPENRKKLPATVAVPDVTFPKEDEFVREARKYVRTNFPKAVGDDEPFRNPTDHAGAEAWLKAFVAERLNQFGDYEDAISARHAVAFHAVLTPMLNTGLISPRQVIDAVLKAKGVPLNSLEGFTRQVIGWREFVRLVYLTHGRRQRTRNYWKLTHDIPAAFYDGTTGIDPVDHVIRQVLRTGYCHHIERLMVLGNFMLLCDVSPDAVYRWFMELFIDAYDWVMVPNVYGMSQHADGGLMTTKPYVSGSGYVLKMSDFKKGPWCAVWDALYWRFIDKHAAFFAANPRMAVMVKMKEKLGDKLNEHRRVAAAFLKKLHA
jgi:deoxyribodipyrimidine photolyase-related protein